MNIFSLLFNCNQFILRKKGAHIHNKIVLCHDYHTSIFGWDPADRAQPLCNRLRNG